VKFGSGRSEILPFLTKILANYPEQMHHIFARDSTCCYDYSTTLHCNQFYYPYFCFGLSECKYCNQIQVLCKNQYELFIGRTSLYCATSN